MTIHIFGGGTITHVRSHLALCAPAAGSTARTLARLLGERAGVDAVQLHLTQMGDPGSSMATNDDVAVRLGQVLADPATRAVIFNVALCDFVGQIGTVPSGKYAERLQTREVGDQGLALMLQPAPKLLGLVTSTRPDVLSVGFKTTAGQDPQTQVARANRMSRETGAHLVLANDVVTRHNLVLAGHGAACLETAHYQGPERQAALSVLVEQVLANLAGRTA